MNTTQTVFLEYLNKAINDASLDTNPQPVKEAGLSEKEITKLLAYAKARGVLPLLYGTGILGKSGEEETLKYCNNFYNLMYDAFRALAILEEARIEAAVLKGIGIAAMYPVPEYRSSGDVDLLLKNASDLDDAITVFNLNGWKVDETDEKSGHHIVLISPRKVMLELHFKPVRPFESQNLNAVIAESFSPEKLKFREFELFGCRAKGLSPAINGFYLLLHALEHFLASGMGIKSLCDLTVFFNKTRDEGFEYIGEYRKLVEEGAVKGFSDFCVALAYKYLGLREEIANRLVGDSGNGDINSFINANSEALSDFLEDILASGNFGELEQGRLVNTAKPGIRGLISQVHYRMKENYPRASKIFLIWPILWLATIIIFLRNNRKIRGQKTSVYIKNAKKRNKIVKKMNLWA